MSSRATATSPYLRFLPDGTVQENRRSPAAYLNEDRFAQVEVPRLGAPRRSPALAARWLENGRYDWHDHRIHWMSKTPPKPVREDESRRVEDLRLEGADRGGGTAGRIDGTLTWLGKDSGGFPAAAAVSLAAVALAGLALVVLVRRRRRPTGDRQTEAW